MRLRARGHENFVDALRSTLRGSTDIYRINKKIKKHIAIEKAMWYKCYNINSLKR